MPVSKHRRRGITRPRPIRPPAATAADQPAWISASRAWRLPRDGDWCPCPDCSAHTCCPDCGGPVVVAHALCSHGGHAITELECAACDLVHYPWG